MNHYLIPALKASPTIIERLLDKIPTSRLDTPLIEDRFTAREVIAHLADWEPIMRGRVELACKSPGATIEVFDEGAMAINNHYAGSDPREQLRLFQSERQITAAFISGMQAEDRQNTLLHPELGIITAEDLANLLLGHDVYHIEQLSAYLKEL